MPVGACRPKGPQFRTTVGKFDALTRRPMRQADAYRKRLPGVLNHSLETYTAEIAKLRFCPSSMPATATPISLPWSFSTGEPLEPCEIGAVICIRSAMTFGGSPAVTHLDPELNFDWVYFQTIDFVNCINLTPLPGLFRGTWVLVFWLSRSIRDFGAIGIEDYREDDNAAGDHLPHEIANTDQD